MFETGESENHRSASSAAGGNLGRNVRNAALLVLGSLVAAHFLSGSTRVWNAIDRTAGQAAPDGAAGAATDGAAFDDGADDPEGRQLAIRAGPGGHFVVDARVNGTRVRFLVDTGASTVALTPGDARRLGLHPARSAFSERYRTPGGDVRGAPVTLDSIRIGALRRDDVRATVMAAPLRMSLLGMSFLNRLEGYRVQNGRLILRW
ncbi:MAG: TIGR02281 family clan AA aspartic protease [Alphaproteobacteria bacterium]